jgi:hypothetical protein
MFRKILKVLLIGSILGLAVLVGVFGINNNFNFEVLTAPVILLSTTFLDYVIAFSTSFDLTGTTNLVIVGGLAFGALIGLSALIRGLIVRKPFSGLFAFVAAINLFAIGVSLIMINPTLPRGRFIWVLVDGIDTDLINTLVIGGALGLVILALFLTYVLGSSPKRRVKVRVVTTMPLSPTVQPSLQPASVTPNAATNTDTLSDLVKAVMQEELNLMRNTQQSNPNQPNQTNPYTNNIDVQMIRRLVTEEVAKFQSQFMSRAEAQSLIAQEILTIKSALKIK